MTTSRTDYDIAKKAEGPREKEVKKREESVVHSRPEKSGMS